MKYTTGTGYIDPSNPGGFQGEEGWWTSGPVTAVLRPNGIIHQRLTAVEFWVAAGVGGQKLPTTKSMSKHIQDFRGLKINDKEIIRARQIAISRLRPRRR
jgi:hypothetical protein